MPNVGFRRQTKTKAEVINDFERELLRITKVEFHLLSFDRCSMTELQAIVSALREANGRR